MRTVLVAALSACVDERQKSKARRFLEGLSRDELQFIAEFLGACILESARRAGDGSPALAEGMTRFARCHGTPHPGCDCLNDQDHKMILLLEYLCRCGLTGSALPVRAGRAG